MRLFNAVSKAQRAAEDASKMRGVGSAKSKQLTKSSFAELKKSAKSMNSEEEEDKEEEEEEEEKKKKKNGSKDKGGGGSTWDVLRTVT